MSPTIRDVASLAGVSRGTVSNVLNKPDVVSAETRDRVMKAIRALHFVPSSAARLLAGGRSTSIALVVYSIANPFFAEIATGVEEVAVRDGLVVSLISTEGDPRRERRALALLQSQQTAGVIFTPTKKVPAFVGDLRAAGIAVVLLDYRGTGSECSVAVNDEHGGKLVAQYLIGRGYRSLTFVGDPQRVEVHAARVRGIKRVVSGATTSKLVHLNIIGVRGGSFEEGQRAAQVLLAGRCRDQASAIICGNDLIAMGMLDSLQREKLRVPEDIAVVGYDDITVARLIAAPLTSVRQPMYELGVRATELLLSEMSEPSHIHQQVEFPPHLIERLTVGTPRSS